ncbi:hypothetical protein CDN99_02020 [Roseateles aquatilis]|uniref:Uncharacterized protein n=1 Tax=Roseateles aquatilis TaxID=431061 RepID=A0A246JM76_9BURK|nr:hypothetical protein CDN99_02020 [Roseateles aquatilis]
MAGSPAQAWPPQLTSTWARPGPARLGSAWLGLAWLGLAWLGPDRIALSRAVSGRPTRDRPARPPRTGIESAACCRSSRPPVIGRSTTPRRVGGPKPRHSRCTRPTR